MASPDLSHFTSIPWTSSLLSTPSTQTFTLAARRPHDANNPLSSRDQLTSLTLNTPDAIPYILGLYTLPKPQPDTRPLQKHFLLDSLTLLFQMNNGTTGHNGIAHGGFFGTLIDEAMGNLFFVNRELQSTLLTPTSASTSSASLSQSKGTYDLEANNFFTAGMSMRYLKPLSTPATVAVTARLVKIEGRKIYFGVEIRGERDVFVTAEGLWIAVPKIGPGKGERL